MLLTLPLLITLVSALTLPPQVPIIGIYTQDRTSNTETYIAASYVKFLEMAGAQVVPIFYKSSQADLKKQLSQLNGVLFPGGGMDLDIKNTFTKNADFILNYAKQQNDQGKVFPIWATCLGHQLLSYLTSGYDSKVIASVSGQGSTVNTLHFLSRNAYVTGNWTDQNFVSATTNHGVLYYNHNWAVYQSYFNSNAQLHNFWNLVATTTSSANQTFVALMQAKKYPFYSVQFHPEKNSFEWHLDAARASMDAIEVPQRLAQAFVQKARQSPNRYSSNEDMFSKFIYNYKVTPVSTGSFQEIYLFTQK